ncbi:Kelch-like protein 38 [Operophtera brumata]|uniref:Kelch-like protein 38 n=1 Tax=Operophtera brumata TaxID=104452 RepID=A0A0L7L3M5_OPEBR|nr:Kelch-like protein 38 [Operophtera brumata]
METGLIDVSEYQLPDIGRLIVAANYLLMTELIKQIEYCLDLQLSSTNWLETMMIAETAACTKLEQLSASFGLLSFNTMKVECIPSVEKLFWYLSHPYLDTSSELDVFKFGMKWFLLHKETGAHALLIILGCLDMKKLTIKDLIVIRAYLLKSHFESFPEKVVECLLKVSEDSQVISESVMISKMESLTEMFTGRVYVEVVNLVRQSNERKLTYTPVVPMWMLNKKDFKQDFVPHYMYTFTENLGFERWLEVADKNLWGWSVVSWGANKLVVVGGEHGRGTGSFMRDVKVYDTLRKEWINHGVQLPPRRHGGVAILGDNLFLRSFSKLPKLPDAIQSPAICTYKGEVYVAGQQNIYKLEESMEGNDKWVTAITTQIRVNRMTAFKDYIYCSQNYFTQMYRFKPGVCVNLEHDQLLAFTRPLCIQDAFLDNRIYVEKYRGQTEEESKIVLTVTQSQFTVNDVAGCCTLVLDMPPLHKHVSQYHQKYLSQCSQF